MSHVDPGVVPSSMERPKRIAKRLRHIFPDMSLSTSQAAVAHLYFHSDWHGLEQAVKKKAPGAPDLDALATAAQDDRGRKQFEILCRELADVDPADSFPSEPPPPLKSGGLSYADVGQQALLLEGHAFRHQSIALGRYRQLLVREALEELRPTARKARAKQQHPPLPKTPEAPVIAFLHARLAAWWAVNFPDGKVLVDQWMDWRLDPHDRIALIEAGAFWSELCVRYASRIDWMMGMGVSFLYASRYASICTQDDPHFDGLAATALNEALPLDERNKALRGVNDLMSEASTRFMDILLRGDFAEMYRLQPRAFMSNAEECLKVLEDPKSGGGVWGH